MTPGSGLTRRGVLGLGGVALAAAGCGDRSPKPPAGGDAAVLGTLLAVERELARAWAAAPAGSLARAARARVRAHVDALLAAGARNGASAPASVRSAADGASGLDALLAAQLAAAAVYLARMPALRGPDARVLAVRLYAEGAQHEAALRLALHREPLPDAFAGTMA